MYWQFVAERYGMYKYISFLLIGNPGRFYCALLLIMHKADGKVKRSFPVETIKRNSEKVKIYLQV